MGILDLFNNVVNTASNAVNSALGNNHPVSQAVKQTANNFTNVSNTVKNVVNSNPVTQNAAKVLTSLNPLGATVNAYNTVTNGLSSLLNNAGIPTPANTLTSGNYNINYYSRDATGNQQTVTVKNTKTGQVDAIAIGGGNFTDYYAQDGTLKTQNYEKAQAESKKLAAGYEYYKGSLRSPAEMQTVRNSGHFDESQYGGTTAKYTQYLSKPTDFGKFVSSGGLNVLNNEKAQTAGYVYDSVSYGTPYENIRQFNSQSGAKKGTTGTTGTTGTAGTPTKAAAKMSGLNAVIDQKLGTDRYTVYGNAANQIKNGNIFSGEVAGGAVTMAADVVLPLDLVYVGNKLFSGNGGELEAGDFISAGIDAAALVAGALSFGAGYAAIKGIKTAAKVAKGTSYATQAGGVGYAGAVLGGVI